VRAARTPPPARACRCTAGSPVRGSGRAARRGHRPRPARRADPVLRTGRRAATLGRSRRTVTAPAKWDESRTNVLTASGGGPASTARSAPDTAGSSNSGDCSRGRRMNEIQAGSPAGSTSRASMRTASGTGLRPAGHAASAPAVSPSASAIAAQASAPSTGSGSLANQHQLTPAPPSPAARRG